MTITSLSAAADSHSTLAPTKAEQEPQSKSKSQMRVKLTDDAVIVGIRNKTVSVGEDGLKDGSFSITKSRTDADGNVQTKVIAGTMSENEDGTVSRDVYKVVQVQRQLEDGSYETYERTGHRSND